MLTDNFGIRSNWAQDYEELFVKSSLMFSDILKLEQGEYEEIEDQEKLIKVILEF